MRFKNYILEESSPEESCIAAVKSAFSEKPLSKSEIKTVVRGDDENEFTPDYIEQIIGDLVRRGELVPNDSGKYELRSA